MPIKCWQTTQSSGEFPLGLQPQILKASIRLQREVSVIGVPGASGRGGPLMTMPAGSFSTILGLHGPESNMSAITAITTTAAIIGQLILLIIVLPWPEILTRLNVTSRKTTSIQR